MSLELTAEADIERFEVKARAFESGRSTTPAVMSVAEVLALQTTETLMLIEGLVPAAGASLLVGQPKAGKTLLAKQIGIAVASNLPLFGEFAILRPGPVMFIEQDDTAGVASAKTVFQASRVPVTPELPLFVVPRVPYEFGEAFCTYLGEEITARSIRLAVLDSYTALRGARSKGGDIVKSEQTDLRALDEVGKQTGCSLLVIHHASKGSSGLDWTQAAAGTFAMSAATEAQINISRFGDLENSAAERWIRIRGRHFEDVEMVLRFCKDSLDFDFVLKGGAAGFYPTLMQISALFGDRTFSPKDLSHQTGSARATAHRQINRLHLAGALVKVGHGSYKVTQ